MKKILFSFMLFIAATMSAQTQTDAYTAETKKLLELTKAKATMVTIISAAWKQNPNITEPEAAARVFVYELWPDIISATATAYKKELTLEELQQITTFLASSAGKKWTNIDSDYLYQEALNNEELLSKVVKTILPYIKK